MHMAMHMSMHMCKRDLGLGAAPPLRVLVYTCPSARLKKEEVLTTTVNTSTYSTTYLGLGAAPPPEAGLERPEGHRHRHRPRGVGDEAWLGRGLGLGAARGLGLELGLREGEG